MAKDKKTKLLEELIKNPQDAEKRADELTKVGLDAAKAGGQAKAAKLIVDDPDAADQSAAFGRLDYPVKLALLNVLSLEGAGAFLARLQREEKDKGVSKAIGAAIHGVRAQGQNVADMRDRKGVRFDFAAEGIPDSYLSALDTEGNRLVLLAKLTPQGRLNVFHVVVGDTQGLSNFEGLALTRSAYKRFVGMAEAQMGVPLAPVNGEYASWLISEAARIGTKNGMPTPAAYGEARTMIEPPSSEPEHPIGRLLDKKEVESASGELVAKSADLHQFAECAFWIPDEDTLEKLSEKVKEADESKVAVSESQKADLRLRAAREIAIAYFDDEKRTLWDRRLKETAYVLAATGRPDEAKLAWATAMAVGKKGSDVAKIPFATELVEKIVKHAGKFDSHAGHDHAPGEHGAGGAGVSNEMRSAMASEGSSGIVKP